MKEASPSARVAAELRRRIASGELAPGQRVPSTRELADSERVAPATAAKALGLLKQEGLVRALPRSGTVVAGPRRKTRALSSRELSRASVVLAAIDIADAEGIGAVTMRSVASAIGVPAMSIYRHVPSKDELLLAMIDAVFADVPTLARHGGWRPFVESFLRAQWTLYREHPWLARALSVARPQLVPNGMRHTESLLASLEGLGLTLGESMQVHLASMSFVRGAAIDIESELELEAETGSSREDWLARHEPMFAKVFQSGGYPRLARMVVTPDLDLAPDAVFEFGLARLCDGLETFFRKAKARNVRA